jgi:hypothetical protein
MSIHVPRALYSSRNFHLKASVMGISEKLLHLVGTWKGANRLYVPWLPEKIRESESVATVRSKMNGQFLSIEYSWSFDNDLQEGLLILGCDPKSDAVQAVWTDSWHSKNVLMVCNGKVANDGSISVFGQYSVPDNPQWGWRTDIIPGEENFRYVMYNVTPEGGEELAVETDFTRASSNALSFE